MLARVMPARACRRGTRCGGRAHPPRCCSSTASTASSPGSTCWRETRRRSSGCARPAAATFLLGAGARHRCRCSLLARGDCRALAAARQLRSGHRADGFFSLGMIADFDASLAGVRAVVLPPSVLGIGRRRAGAVSRGRSRRRARHRHRLFLRRSGARRARPDRARVSEPLSLHGRRRRSRTRG